MLIGLPDGHSADVVADALAAKIAELPEQLRRSLTWDQGSEMAQHAKFSVETGVPVYFCDPRSPCSAAPTRTPMVCCVSTSRNAGYSRTTRPGSTPSPPSSTGGLDKPSDGRHHQKCSTRRCVDRLRPSPFRDGRYRLGRPGRRGPVDGWIHVSGAPAGQSDAVDVDRAEPCRTSPDPGWEFPGRDRSRHPDASS